MAKRERTELQDEFYTVDEFASLMKVTPLTVRRWMASGKIPYYTIGGTVRFSRKDIEEFYRVDNR